MTFQVLLNELAEATRTNRDKGTQFEKLIANYLLTDPQYADRLADVWLWSEWPDRWDTDVGIDLVARERGTGGVLDPWVEQLEADVTALFADGCDGAFDLFNCVCAFFTAACAFIRLCRSHRSASQPFLRHCLSHHFAVSAQRFTWLAGLVFTQLPLLRSLLDERLALALLANSFCSSL